MLMQNCDKSVTIQERRHHNGGMITGNETLLAITLSQQPSTGMTFRGRRSHIYKMVGPSQLPPETSSDHLWRLTEAIREAGIRDDEGAQTAREYPWRDALFDFGIEGEDDADEVGRAIEGADHAQFAERNEELKRRGKKAAGEEYDEEDATDVHGDTFTSHHDTDKDWQDLNRGEPMDIAMRLLKEGR